MINMKSGCAAILLCAVFSSRAETLTYYLNVIDFIDSIVTITAAPVGSDVLGVSNFAGRAPLYELNNNKQVGTCSASFLSIKTADGIFTDIANYIAVDNGLIVTWFTPTNPIALEIDSIINSMVTECIVMANTKVIANPFYGQTFNLIVSSSGGKIYFQFTRTGTIF